MSTAAAPTESKSSVTKSPNTNKPQAGGYDVARPMGKCHVTGEPINIGEKFMAALRETPVGFERVDVSMAAWANFERGSIVGFWQATMPAQEQKKKLFVDDEVLCDLFERLKDTTEPSKLNFRFVLGLILMRKKMLVYENTRVEDGKDIWMLHFKGREDKLDLLDPKLDEAQVAEVSQQLGQILNEELQRMRCRLTTLMLAGLLCGCAHTTQPANKPAPYYGSTLSLQELVRQIDVNNSKIPTLWATVELFEADFYDNDKKHQHELLYGSLSYRSPRDFSLIGQKAPVGTVLEIGSNQNDYWFALPDEHVGQTIWTGRYKYLGMPCTQSIPIRPDLLLDVLGVATINPDLNQSPTPVMRFNHAADAYMLDWVERSLDSDRWVITKEVWYDRKTLRPTIVRGFDANGHVSLEAYLSKFIKIKTPASEDQWPEMASDFRVYFPESKAALHIVLASPTLKFVFHKVLVPNNLTFDLNHYKGNLKVIQLDEACGP